VDGVGVGRGKLVGDRDVVDLDRDVLLLIDEGLDLIVDGDEGLGDVLAAAVALDERDDGLRLGGGLQRERGAGRGKGGEPHHLAAGEAKGRHGGTSSHKSCRHDCRHGELTARSTNQNRSLTSYMAL
jgi:hypothetical protein